MPIHIILHSFTSWPFFMIRYFGFISYTSRYFIFLIADSFLSASDLGYLYLYWSYSSRVISPLRYF